MTEYLGSIDWGAVGSNGRPFAQLRPLYRSIDNPLEPHEQSWHRIEDAVNEFPNRGYVTWYESPPEALKNTIWQFKVEHQTYDPLKPNHDAFRVHPLPSPPKEIIDMRQVGDADLVRQQLSHEGVQLSFVPSKHLYVWVQDKDWVAWIGPLQLIHSKETGAWAVDQVQLESPLMCFLPAPDHQVVYLNINGRRLFLCPGAKPGSRIGQIDWSSDTTVLKRVIQRQHSIAPAYKNDLKHIVEQFSNNGLIGADTFLENQRLQRARLIASGLLQRQETVEFLVEDLLNIHSIESQIDEVKNAVSRETESQVRAKLGKELAHVEELKSEKTNIEEEIKRLKRERDEQRSALETEVQNREANLESALKERLQKLMSQPEQALADIAVYRAALGINTSGQNHPETSPPVVEGTGSIPSSISHSPSLSFERDQATVVQEPQQFRQSLRNALRARSMSASIARPLHSAFLSGAMPVLVGSGSLEALEAYASCVAGGIVRWLPISAATIEPNDLLGRVSPATGRFIPQAGGLIDLLIHATTTDNLFLVILDGINRAAVDAYLTPILSCYSDAWHGEQRRALPVFHPKAVTAGDPYSSVAWLQWPSNVLLAGVLTEGVAVVSPPQAFWGSTVLLHLGQFDKENKRDVENRTSLPADVSIVSTSTWSQWRESVFSTDITARPKLKEFFEISSEANLRLRQECQSLCARLYASAQTWTNEDRALEDTIIHCIVPQVVASNQETILFDILNQMQKMSARIQLAAQLAQQVLV
jgi:hypothetical protein